MVMSILNDLALSLIMYFPFMVANAMPLFIKHGKPLDMGRFFIDGRRILGDSKTFEGFINGLLFGTLITSYYYLVTSNTNWLIYGVLGSLGALLGDITNSFLKRRLGLRPGAPLPILDQINFVLGSTFIVKVTSLDEAVGIVIDLKIFVIALIINYLLHRLTNYLAFKLGLKKVPW